MNLTSTAKPECGVREGLERARVSLERLMLTRTAVDMQLGRVNDVDLTSSFFQNRAWLGISDSRNRTTIGTGKRAKTREVTKL